MITPVVDASWLADHPEVVLADVRWYADGRSAREAYAQGHLPGAVYVDLDGQLAGPPSPAAGRHPLPDPDAFARSMAACGIGDDTLVVGYDDDRGAIAARLVWMLRATGHQAALLDGGLLGWTGPLETGEVTPAPASFTPVPWPPDRLASIDEACDAVLLDARPGARFRGEVDSLDPRPGHIPGARNLPCRDNTDSDGRLLPAAELRARLAEVGVTGDAEWVSSCGSGVTACHTLLVAEQLGLRPGRLYVGSWSQWSATDRPAAVGA
ncbi:MAG: sulfurtransferase [Mycobacteriales bacterium]